MRSLSHRATLSGVDQSEFERNVRDGGLFINTAGIGIVIAPNSVGPAAVQPGDAVIISGGLGAHGIAVLSVREGSNSKVR